MAWFDNLKTPKIKAKGQVKESKVPEGMWLKCPECSEILQKTNLANHLFICPACQHHLRMGALERIESLVDSGTFIEKDADLASLDPLQFKDLKNYSERLEKAQERTGIRDGLLYGEAKLEGIPIAIAAFEFKFMGGSMGVVVGEKIARTFELALKKKIPAIVVSASGGARMQEGILSLMQMAKTTSLITEMNQKGIPYISVLSDPTTGGVAASFAMLGDIILAEPKALVGFAGPRVIQQTIRQELPEGFQRAEFLLEHGFLDQIVHRQDLKATIGCLLGHLVGASTGSPATRAKKEPPSRKSPPSKKKTSKRNTASGQRRVPLVSSKRR